MSSTSSEATLGIRPKSRISVLKMLGFGVECDSEGFRWAGTSSGNPQGFAASFREALAIGAGPLLALCRRCVADAAC